MNDGVIVSLIGVSVSILGSLVTISFWSGGLHAKMLESERRAKHDAVNAVSTELARLELRKVNVEKYEDLVRRVHILERRAGLNGTKE